MSSPQRQQWKRSPLLALLALGLAWSLPGVAQEQAKQAGVLDRNRAQVSRTLSEGNLAAAEELLAGLTKDVATRAASPAWKVAFEELKACGFYPQETRLECVLDVKQTAGYGGHVGQFGSFEFVQFCVDWDGNGSFSAGESVGVGIVHMHDESAGARPPWQYAVYRDIDPPGCLTRPGCVRTDNANPTTTKTNGPTRRARAILSWAVAPNGCNFSPVWGNVVDFRIRFDPIR